MTENKKNRIYERYPRFTLLLVAVIGILLVLVMAEVISRFFFPQWAPVTSERAKFWQFDSTLGWSQIPNKQAIFNHPDFSTQVAINSLGLRDREYSVERNQKKRMLVLGDSYGWGFGVNADEIFTEILEARHPDWEIINASVSGYGTVQEYLYLQQRGILLKPDLVLVLFNDNDFQDSVGITEYWYNKPIVSKIDDHYEITGLPVPPQTWRQRMDVYLLGNFYIARGLYFSLQLPVSLLEQLVSSPQPVLEVDSLDATGYVLGKMIALDQSNKMQTVVVQTPLSDVKHAAVETQCLKYAIPCLHLKEAFKANKNTKWHFEHDRHWNQTGHRMAADAIDAFLAQQGLWDKP